MSPRFQISSAQTNLPPTTHIHEPSQLLVWLCSNTYQLSTLESQLRTRTVYRYICKHRVQVKRTQERGNTKQRLQCRRRTFLQTRTQLTGGGWDVGWGRWRHTRLADRGWAGLGYKRRSWIQTSTQWRGSRIGCIIFKGGGALLSLSWHYYLSFDHGASQGKLVLCQPANLQRLPIIAGSV